MRESGLGSAFDRTGCRRVPLVRPVEHRDCATVSSARHRTTRRLAARKSTRVESRQAPGSEGQRDRNGVHGSRCRCGRRTCWRPATSMPGRASERLAFGARCNGLTEVPLSNRLDRPHVGAFQSVASEPPVGLPYVAPRIDRAAIEPRSMGPETGLPSTLALTDLGRGRRSWRNCGWWRETRR